MKKFHLLFSFAMFFVVVSTTGVGAATIRYDAIDIADLNLGEDLWEYSYSVSDHSFSASTGFTIYFDVGLYDLLEPYPTAPNADWDVITWNPDHSLPDDGAYDANALIDDASLSDFFTVSFVWLGGESGPGSQFFEIYDGLSWNVLEDDFTTAATAPIPEPATAILLVIGLLSYLLVKKKIKY